MKIGDLAQKAGVNIETLRFYERKGILRKPPRTKSGYRMYGEQDLDCVRFVRRCQNVGFTLKEIRELAELHAFGHDPNAKGAAARRGIQAIARERLRIIDEQRESLGMMRQQLLGLLNETDGNPDPICPFQETRTKTS